jgi:pimeloyl-ACP methyl ester carboxylesterase
LALDPLVLVPGIGADAAVFRHQAEHLRGITDITIPDLVDGSSREELARRLLAETPERFALCGHSMGGWVAIRTALDAPERVTRLVLMDTFAGPAPEQLKQGLREAIERAEEGDWETFLGGFMLGLLDAGRAEDAEVGPVIRAMQRRVGPDTCLRHARAILAEDGPPPDLSHIDCPTLIVHGRGDELFSVTDHERLATQIPGARLVVIEDAGHMSPVERPQAVTALLRLWLVL